MKKTILPFVFAAVASALAAQEQASESPAIPNPLTLDAAIAYAASHNPALQRVREQVAEQQGVLVEVQARRVPNVGASASYSITDESLLKGPTGAAVTDDQAWEMSVSATQVLYAGGAITAATHAQREQVEAARHTVQVTIQDTLLDVRERFYAVLLSRDIIAVREEALRLLEAEAERARMQRDVGSGSDFDVLRAEVAVANARPDLIRARNQYQVAQDALRTTLGAPATEKTAATDLGVVGELPTSDWSPALEAAITTAIEQRPELLAQDSSVRAADAAVTSARAGYKPTVSLFGGYSLRKSSYSDRLGDTNNGWSAGVQADWAIFDGRATTGRVQQARSRAQQARLGATELRLGVEMEVRQYHAALVEATELLAASEQVVAQARESLRLAKARFDAGSATQLDVLAAQTALTEASFNEASARHDHAVAVARLQRAMGQQS